jgi:hypothetical protein
MNAVPRLNPTPLKPAHGSRQAQPPVLRKLIYPIRHKKFTYVPTNRLFKLNKTGYAVIDLGTNIGQAKYAFSFDITAAPLAVTGLTATANVNEIDLAWSDPPYNPMASLTVLQSTDGGVTWTTIATLDPSATSFAAANLNPGLSYSYKIGSNRNTSGGSATTGATAPTPPLPSPRYAVVDLGTNITPVAMNSNCDVVGGTTLWSQGTNYNLSSGGFTNPAATGIDDSGHMAGNSAGQIVYWAGKTSTPVGLGTNVLLPGGSAPFGIQSGEACMGGDGSIAGTVGYNHDLIGDVAATFTPGGSPAWLWSPNPTNQGLPNNVSTPSKARGHWAGNYTSSSGGGGGAVVDGTEYPGQLAYAVNDSGVAVGTDYTNAIIIAGTGAGTTLGPGYAGALNSVTVMSGTNVVAQPQIIGNTTSSSSGNPMLWDHTNLDGTTSSTYVGKNINTLIPANSGWSVDYVAAINNAGCIAGTANYSGTNAAIPQGYHGVILVPCQFRLLNGAQSGTDGLNFDGTRPTKISATSPDNTTATTDIGNSTSGTGNSGIDLLGIDPFGQGRSQYPGDAYVASILMVAKVMPASMPNVTYSWDRTYKDRMIWIHWTGGLSGIGTWQVTSLNNGTTQKTGLLTPVEDSLNPVGTDHSVIPSPKQLLYFYDNPGMNMALWSYASLYDLAYEEKDFTYTLTISVGNGVSTSAVVHVGQTTIAKVGGTASSLVWQPVSNTVSTSGIPSCLITKAKVQTALAAAGNWSTVYPINIDSHANDANPNP